MLHHVLEDFFCNTETSNKFTFYYNWTTGTHIWYNLFLGKRIHCWRVHFIYSNILVDIDYYTITVSEQINENLIIVISQTQGPVLHNMRLFRMTEISPYCGNIHSICKVCNIYHVNSQTYQMLRQDMTITKWILLSDWQVHCLSSLTQINHYNWYTKNEQNKAWSKGR